MGPDSLRERLNEARFSSKYRKTSEFGNKERLRRIVASVPWSVVVMTAALFDILLMCFSEWSEPLENLDWLSDAQCTFVILSVYTLDVVMKIYAFSLQTYLSKIGNMVDFGITVLSILLALLETSVAMTNGIVALRAPRITRLFFRVLKIGHCCRGARFAHVGAVEGIMGARNMVGANRRRYVDPENDFDLDLAYIRERLIAMSVPAVSFLMGMYRNPISEVVRFFETYHEGNYMIVNCCPELPYPHDRFTTGRVMRFDIQDHTPPTLAQFVEFLEVAREWMRNKDHVMAIHCKGGKGRTGSLCSAWMIYTGDAHTGDEAVNLFANGRTDSFMHLKIHPQTVDTPSQVRYLNHVQDMLAEQQTVYPKQVVLPECRRLRPVRLTLKDWFLVPVQDDLTVALHEREDGGPGRVRHWSPTFRHDASGSAVVELQVPEDFSLQGDVRVSVFVQSKLQQARAAKPNGCAFPGDSAGAAASLAAEPSKEHRTAGEEPGCLFYFMFHTSFIGEDGVLELSLAEMDKAGKGKHKKRYCANGSALFEYSVPEGAAQRRPWCLQG